MPHKCLRCSKVYEDSSLEILLGCACGSKLFLFVKNVEDMGSAEKGSEDTEIVRAKSKERPIILDVETIRIIKQGKYEIDLQKIFKRQQLVVKLGDGKYYVDLVSGFGNKVKGDKLEIV